MSGVACLFVVSIKRQDQSASASDGRSFLDALRPGGRFMPRNGVEFGEETEIKDGKLKTGMSGPKKIMQLKMCT